jgi:hypothetical protein
MQLNVAKAINVGDRSGEWSSFTLCPALLMRERGSDRHIECLGQAGNPHYNKQDSPVGLTYMFNLSKEHPDVQHELFTILSLGLCFVVPPLSAVYFLGLYLHTGTQPVYTSPQSDPKDYYQVTLICYPPKDVLHNHGSLALGMGVDGEIVKHTLEMRTSWLVIVLGCQ